MKIGNFNVRIVGRTKANELMKFYGDSLKVAVISIVKNRVDVKALTNFSSFRGPKLQIKLRDIKKEHRFKFYHKNEIPNIENLEVIFNFIDIIKPLDIEVLIIHCRRGVSRSGATAIAILSYMYGDKNFRRGSRLARKFKLTSDLDAGKKIFPNPVFLKNCSKILKTRIF